MTKNNKFLVIKLSEEDKAVISKYAKEERRTLTAFVVNGLMQYIKKKEVND